MQKIMRKQVLSYVNNYLSNSKALGDGYCFEGIKDYCTTETLGVDETIIKNFLKQKAKEAGIDIDENIEGSGWVTLTGENTDSLIECSLKRFDKQLKRAKYEFNEIDLKYFKDLFRIYKWKCFKLCEIIEMMAGKIAINKTFENLDITMTERSVLVEDVDRVVKPLIVNYLNAIKIQEKANDLNTYLTTILNETAMGHAGVSYIECLPSTSLQNKSYFACNSDEYVALTEKQKEEIKRKEKEDIKASFNSFLSDILK